MQRLLALLLLCTTLPLSAQVPATTARPQPHSAALDVITANAGTLNLGSVSLTVPATFTVGSFNLTATNTGNILTSAGGNGSALTGLAAAQIGFTSSATGAVATTLQSVLSQNPLRLVADFGADPTGATDNHTQILAWLTAGCVTHRPLLAEAGTFKSSTAITMANGISTGNTYGDGLVMMGMGMNQTVFNFSSDTDGFVFPHALQNAVFKDFCVERLSTSTHRGIHTDGTVAEDGGGGGASMNNCVLQNVQVTGFQISLDLYYWSNGQVLNCSLGGTGAQKCVHLYGSSNSDLFDTTPADGTVYGYELSGGQAITVRGADINTPMSGSAIGVEVDGSVSVTIINCRCENNGSGYPAEVASGSSANFIGSAFQNFSGTATYGLHCAGTVAAINSGFVGTSGGVRQETTGFFTSDGPVEVDYFNPTKIDGWAFTRFPSLGTNDGTTATTATNGLFRILDYHEAAEANLQWFHGKAGGYVLDDINQYNEDVRAGVAAKTATANTFTATQTLASIAGVNWVLPGETGTPGTNAASGLAFNGATHWLLGCDVVFGNDWGLLRAHGGGTGNARDLVLLCDPSLNWHLGWDNTGAAASQPNGTAGLNLYHGTLYKNPLTYATLPASPRSGTSAIITDCNTSTFNATAAGGGSNVMNVFYNGTNWVVY